jgi:hypothetical protein
MGFTMPMPINTLLRSDLRTLQIAEDHQKAMYEGLQSNSLWLGRCRSPFLPLREVATEVVSKPIAAIEAIVNSFLQLTYSLFNKNYSVQNSIFYLEKSIAHIIDTPLAALASSYQYIYQVFSIAFDQKNALSFKELSKSMQIAFEPSDLMARAIYDNQLELYLPPEDVEETDQPYFSSWIYRCISPMIAFIDVTLDTLSPIADSVESIFYATKQLFGAIARKPEHSIKGSIYFINKAHISISKAVAAIVMSPIKLVYQTCAIIQDPINISTIAGPLEEEEIQDFLSKFNDAPQNFSEVLSIKHLQKILLSNTLHWKIINEVMDSISPSQVNELILSLPQNIFQESLGDNLLAPLLREKTGPDKQFPIKRFQGLSPQAINKIIPSIIQPEMRSWCKRLTYDQVQGIDGSKLDLPTIEIMLLSEEVDTDRTYSRFNWLSLDQFKAALKNSKWLDPNGEKKWIANYLLSKLSTSRRDDFLKAFQEWAAKQRRPA